MPIGMPKIPFLLDGDEEDEEEDDDATWVDLYNVLYRTRSIFLGDAIHFEVANHIAGLMIFLTIQDATQNLYFFINSPGGMAVAGLLIYDTMQYVTPPVYTLGLGVLASMASFLLVGGETSKRLMGPNARVMIHQPESDYTHKDKTLEVQLDSGEVEDIRNMVIRVYLERTRLPREVLNDHLERNYFMTATEAKYYGIVDDIGIQNLLARLREESASQDNSLDPDAPDESASQDNSLDPDAPDETRPPKLR
uniref:ATP-dependent Clp protease proteolytic subunit n=3 Tax=Oenothera TaxID=3939 RepID=A0A0U2UMI1_9MYRT|nr:clp protease proteolytic subunit [Oenothera glazioviana]YP_009228606.1 clp protease proteolytic subunit [Oenothera grandiflora]AOY35222.1 clp protease proteolytic subunit [Oenothera biennis]ABX10062.1 clp protease proteolytic subunit [Oenothera glazioviana]ALR86192.1 clp protease proteolytic subunit [Oenothera glazioviana]ALR86276.1 clp protease proteolytic subunit [Oenothera glazioviana]ALR86360.1 clp protease proteolytic subunit [Oenothera grandiflora]